MSDDEKKIFIDEDWKSRVEEEREAALAAKEKQESQPSSADPSSTEPSSAGESQASTAPEEPASSQQTDDEEIGVHPLPPASFGMFISSLASEAMVGLGQMANPSTGKAQVNLELAKYFIDVLQIIEEKTRGNLTPDEKAGLEALLDQLRLAFVAVKNHESAKK